MSRKFNCSIYFLFSQKLPKQDLFQNWDLTVFSCYLGCGLIFENMQREKIFLSDFWQNVSMQRKCTIRWYISFGLLLSIKLENVSWVTVLGQSSRLSIYDLLCLVSFECIFFYYFQSFLYHLWWNIYHKYCKSSALVYPLPNTQPFVHYFNKFRVASWLSGVHVSLSFIVSVVCTHRQHSLSISHYQCHDCDATINLLRHYIQDHFLWKIENVANSPKIAKSPSRAHALCGTP